MNVIKSMLQNYMKDPEFARELFTEELILAITEAIRETLNSYGFKQDASNKSLKSENYESPVCGICGEEHFDFECPNR